jgi:hypothetical protein
MIDPKVLESCIAEAADGDAEMATFLRERYAKNEAAAVKFVGGFMRQGDYTKKSQELAAQRTQYEGQSTRLAQLETALTAAEVEKNKILKDLATHRVSTAKARELMTILQDKYQLTDDDLPGMSDLIATAKAGKPVDNTDDLDARLAAIKGEWMAEAEKKFSGAMIPELSSMAIMPVVWQEIQREHQDLTGKPLTAAECEGILKDAKDKKMSLRGAWESKFEVGGDSGLRMTKRDERLKQSWQQDREKDDAAKLSAAALDQVTPRPVDLGTGPNISRAFKTRFKSFEMDPNKPAEAPAAGAPSVTVQPGQHVRQQSGARIPASQRAAAKFIERQAGGKAA